MYIVAYVYNFITGAYGVLTMNILFLHKNTHALLKCAVLILTRTHSLRHIIATRNIRTHAERNVNVSPLSSTAPHVIRAFESGTNRRHHRQCICRRPVCLRRMYKIFSRLCRTRTHNLVNMFYQGFSQLRRHSFRYVFTKRRRGEHWSVAAILMYANNEAPHERKIPTLPAMVTKSGTTMTP